MVIGFILLGLSKLDLWIIIKFSICKTYTICCLYSHLLNIFDYNLKFCSYLFIPVFCLLNVKCGPRVILIKASKQKKWKARKRSLLEASKSQTRIMGQNSGEGGWNMSSFLYGFIILLYFGVAATFLWFFSNQNNLDRVKQRW